MKAVYIHLPFCSTICTYCDFCKILYNEDIVNRYLVALRKEIIDNYKGEQIKTLYIGGGTPSVLSVKQMENLFNILSIFKLEKDSELTFECNVENITKEKVEILKKNKINRLSIGIETFNSKYLKLLGRKHIKEEIQKKIKFVKKYFKNVNIDLMYAFETETMEELRYDLEEAIKLKPTHISIYSLIIEPHTRLFLEKHKNVSEEIDSDMFNYIRVELSKNGYDHYEISNFSKKGYESKHNLTYWNNLEYYGFGAGASGYINNVRYDNTKSVFNYLKGDTKILEEKQTEKEKLENEFILGFRKISGINKTDFNKKYNMDVTEVYSIKKLLKEEKIIENERYVYINPKYLYIMNEILIEFLDMKEGI